MAELNELVLEDEVIKMLDDIVASEQLDIPSVFQAISGSLKSFQQFLNLIENNNSPEAEHIIQELKSVERDSKQTRVKVNESNCVATYANFCRVSSTPEELILDFGLNPQPLDPENTTIIVSLRIILNHYTAKRLLSALSMALQRHEQAFGFLDTDIRKRVVRRST